jgi:hypothetical protein
VARRRLLDIELSRGSRAVRQALFWVIGGGGAIAALTYVVPSHHLAYESESHSGYADSGYIPLVGLAGVTILVMWLARQRFGAGMIAAVVAGTSAFLEFARAVLAHLLSNVVTEGPEILHIVALVAVFGASVLMLVLEPVLYVIERSSQERAERSIPTARVVSR